jgi:hypothetical protein
MQRTLGRHLTVSAHQPTRFTDGRTILCFGPVGRRQAFLPLPAPSLPTTSFLKTSYQPSDRTQMDDRVDCFGFYSNVPHFDVCPPARPQAIRR